MYRTFFILFSFIPGTYVYVNMSGSLKYGDRARLESPVYNPTPPYSSDETSPYFKSCQVSIKSINNKAETILTERN